MVSRHNPLLLSLSLLLAAASLSAQTRGELAVVEANFSDIAARYQRLSESGLLTPAERRRPQRSLLAPPKEAPRPGRRLIQEPRMPVPVGRLALPEPRATVSPNSPRSLGGFPALDDNLTAIPPDTYGAVGRNHVMTVLNSEVMIQDRQGRVLSRVILEDFFRAHSPVEIAFDPRVSYDPRADRWIFCVLTEPESSNNALYVAVSQTPDPTGRWSIYRFTPDLSSSWMDYPTMAISGRWLIITVNNFSLTTSRYQRATVFAFTLQDLFQGRRQFRTFSDSELMAPVQDLSTAANRPATLISSFDNDLAGQGVIRVSEIRGEPGAETFEADVARLRVPQPWAFRAGEDLIGPQLGSNAKLDLGDDRMQQCVLRNTTIWCAHTVFLPTGSTPNRAGIQWLEIANEGSFSYRLTRHGRIEDPTAESMYAYPGIAVNRNNDVLIGYSRFSGRQFVSANFSFRAGTDPVGQFQADSVFKQGESAFRQRGRTNRWGDYSVAQVDPVDDLSLWTIQEYAASQTTGGVSRWGTWWAQVTPHTAPCTYTLGSTAINVSNQASTVNITVRGARADCRWMAAPNAPWITATGTPGVGEGAVVLNIARNTSTAERRGTVVLAGQEITVTQLAGPAAPDLVISSVTAPTSAVLGRTMNVTSEVRNIGTLPAGPFRLGFFLSRRPVVTAQDTYTGNFCDFTNGLQPTQVSSCNGAVRVPANLAPGSYYLAAIADFENRLTIANRETTIRDADTGPINLQIAADAPAFSQSGVVHGANGLSASVTPVITPGQVVVIYGQRLGGTELVSATLTGSRFPTSISGTSVLFDGIAAPLLYVAPSQLAVMAPFNLNTTRGTTNVQIQAAGLPSDTLTLSVAPSAPGLFTVDFSGTGAVACLNQNSSVNTNANPAERGTVVQLYGTGFGAFTPPAADGSVVGTPLPTLRDPVRVEIGGRPAQVLYAGPAPGLVAGVIQINAVVPAEVTPGATPVRVFSGGVVSRAGTTLYVR